VLPSRHFSHIFGVFDGRIVPEFCVLSDSDFCMWRSSFQDIVTNKKLLVRTVRFLVVVLSWYLLQPLRLNNIFSEESCDFSTNFQVITKNIFVLDDTLLHCTFPYFLSERYTAA